MDAEQRKLLEDCASDPAAWPWQNAIAAALAEIDELRAALAPVARELTITTNTKGGVYLDRDEAAAVLAACQDCPGAPAKAKPRPLNETSG